MTLKNVVGALLPSNFQALYQKGKSNKVRRLSPNTASMVGNATSRRINELLSIHSAGPYLEIGLSYGETFEAVQSTTRIGVDPRPLFDISQLPSGMDIAKMSSDDFFERSNITVGSVLIDGLHSATQVQKDLANTLKVLHPRGFILIDDTIPNDAVSAISSKRLSHLEAIRQGMDFPRPWMGDVYKVLPLLSECMDFLEFYTYVEEGIRPQTVLWPRREVSAKDLRKVLGFNIGEIRSYTSIFQFGMPEEFHPANGESIGKAFLHHQNQQFSHVSGM